MHAHDIVPNSTLNTIFKTMIIGMGPVGGDSHYNDFCSNLYDFYKPYVFQKASFSLSITSLTWPKKPNPMLA